MLRRVLVEDNEHSDALYYLGFLYENGLGTDRDLKTSMRYYQKAVKASGEQNAKAMYKLGNFLYSGEAGGVNKGTQKNKKKRKKKLINRTSSLFIFKSCRIGR
jgi:TPR repeat protein